jgi:hypothetical protein
VELKAKKNNEKHPIQICKNPRIDLAKLSLKTYAKTT